MNQAPGNPFPFAPTPTEDAIFAEPWQARAFGVTMALYQAGHFTWPEWVEALSGEIAAAKARGDPDTGETYYLHWLAALERIVAAKNLSAAFELRTRKGEWAQAAAHTPHGKPIVLGAHDHHHDH